MTITAIYENGVFRPLQPVNLPDKTQVEIQNVSVLQSLSETADRPLMRLVEIAQRFEDDPTTPSDLSEQLDHYLYGMPKRK
jgi:predicted DNA-binding antitoxin AbrB/MazE fold protein